MAVDLGQSAGHAGLGLVFRQLFALAGLDAAVLQVGVYPVQAAEGGDQGKGGLFADARHAGDIVAGVPHEGLDLDELFGLHPVFFPHGGFVHHHRLAAAHLGGSQQNGHAGGGQLQAVPVTGGDAALVPPGGAGGGQSAQDVVGLPALPADHHKAQSRQQFLQRRQLVGQLLGHALAGALVLVVHLVAEGGGLEVKGDGHLVGGLVGQKFGQNIQKSINGVGVAAVVGGEQLDAVKGAVDDAVSVQNQ